VVIDWEEMDRELKVAAAFALTDDEREEAGGHNPLESFQRRPMRYSPSRRRFWSIASSCEIGAVATYRSRYNP